MHLENEAHDLERIAKPFRLISKEISFGVRPQCPACDSGDRLHFDKISRPFALVHIGPASLPACRATSVATTTTRRAGTSASRSASTFSLGSPCAAAMGSFVGSCRPRSTATAPTGSVTERTDMDALSPSNSCAPPARDPAAALGHPSSPATAAPGSSSGSAPLSREKTCPTCKKLFRRKSALSDAQWKPRIFCSRRCWAISPEATKKSKAGWAQYKLEQISEERKKLSPLDVIHLNRIIADAAPARHPGIKSVDQFLAKVGANHCSPAFAAPSKQVCKP
jgi:hypothetical protein